jgi:hypothetical protein
MAYVYNSMQHNGDVSREGSTHGVNTSPKITVTVFGIIVI